MAENNGKSSWMSWVLIAIVVGLIVVNIVYVFNRDSSSRAAVDEPAPEFDLPVVNATAETGDTVALADTAGKIVVLKFFSTT